MSYLNRFVHILAVGTWFGVIVFWSFAVTLPVLASMKQFATSGDNWLFLKTEKEGNRLAGEFLNVGFRYYFPVQGICGALAVLTCFSWWKLGGLHRVRVIVLFAGMTLALLNLLWLGRVVHNLRVARYGSDAAAAEAANADFAFWHNLSLGADMIGLLCVFVGLLLAPLLPGRDLTPRPPSLEGKGE
jgi:hypothetical protein